MQSIIFMLYHNTNIINAIFDCIVEDKGNYANTQNPHYKDTKITDIGNVDYIKIILEKGYRNFKQLPKNILPIQSIITTYAEKNNIQALLFNFNNMTKEDSIEFRNVHRAIELGSVKAMIEMGNWYKANTDSDLAKVYYQKAKECGDEEVLLYLPKIDEVIKLKEMVKSQSQLQEIIKLQSQEITELKEIVKLQSQQLADQLKENSILCKTNAIYYDKFNSHI